MHAVEPFLARARQPTPGPGSGASHDKQVLAGLLDATAAGDERAFAQLHRRTSARLRAAAWRVLRRHDLAEEAVQDAYMQIWAHAAKYRATVSAPMTWMTTIVRNRALDHLRQRQRESVWLADSDAEVDCEFPGERVAGPRNPAGARKRAACGAAGTRRAGGDGATRARAQPRERAEPCRSRSRTRRAARLGQELDPPRARTRARQGIPARPPLPRRRGFICPWRPDRPPAQTSRMPRAAPEGESRESAGGIPRRAA